ncbi:hypothetical protein NDU88_004446 [Pleurodeles waltl]|uniref:Uncharacterized protein n=1 Tax=Pleurodeles waltl TaxID=8319 RepID=A0AAV7WRV6_PLEWA|nr:hypothetical protein NDU88_004446 [Pleurodeles waltl]
MGRGAGRRAAWRAGGHADGPVRWAAGELPIVGGQLGARGKASIGVAGWCLGVLGGHLAVESDRGLPPLSLPLWLELDDFAAGYRWLLKLLHLERMAAWSDSLA